MLILQGLQRQKICRTEGAFAYPTRLTQRLRAGLTCGAPPALGPRIRIAPLGEMADRPKGRPLQKKERVAYPYSIRGKRRCCKIERSPPPRLRRGQAEGGPYKAPSSAKVAPKSETPRMGWGAMGERSVP